MNARSQQVSPRLRGNQGGVVMIVFVIALVVMLGTVGLALDGAHGMLSKTRLQNVVDAAALSAAKTLDVSDSDTVLATAEALDMFTDNAIEAGHEELFGSYNAGELSVSVEFSATLDPFAPGTAPADYVRVTATGFDLPGWLIPVLGVDQLTVAATAVAGPSPTLGEVCNVVPMMACGDASDPSDPLYGYTPGEVTVLKTSAGGGDFEVGPGNFQLMRLDGDTGGADLRESLAGSFDSCVSTQDETVETEPGNSIGPVTQGINTRLGIYSGPMSGQRDRYPPDLPLDQITPLTSEDGTVYYNGIANPTSADLPFDYEDYLANLLNSGFWTEYDQNGVEFRRVLRMPVGDCDGTTNGQGQVEVLGVLCFLLLQEAIQRGNEAEIYGQFMGADAGCPVTGTPGPEPSAGPGPYRIQLYKDPDATSA